MSLKTEATNYAFGGVLYKYSHAPSSLKTKEAKFNVFLPPKAFHDKKPVPVLYYLAGLTCTEDNGPQKGAFLGPAAKNNIALVFPDTSPRGADIEGEDKDWDFGTGAGFYITATKAPYSQHYNMYEYVTSELPKVIEDAGLPIDTSKASIFGHSMGGHGALTLYLKNPSLYKSASAFAPITNPTKCPWGEKAFGGYLKGGVEEGKQHDATEIIKSLDASRKLHILIDQVRWYNGTRTY